MSCSNHPEPGYIDSGFDLFSDGRRLVYVTVDETAQSDAVITPAATRVYRMRVLEDVDACADAAPCRYDAGPLVMERTGSSNRARVAALERGWHGRLRGGL